MSLTTTYSHAAPYIREALMNATGQKLSATTIRSRREYVGQMYGFIHSLEILLASPEGQNSESGYPDWRGVDESKVLAELERFVGGPDRMEALGFNHRG